MVGFKKSTYTHPGNINHLSNETKTLILALKIVREYGLEIKATLPPTAFAESKFFYKGFCLD